MNARNKQKVEVQPSHSCNKTSLQKVLVENVEYKERLIRYIRTIHNLSSHATFAFKLYILSKSTFPTVCKETFECLLYLLNKGEKWKPRSTLKQSIKNDLSSVVRDYCGIVGFVHPKLGGDQQSINYLTESMFTNLKVNVQEHFCKMLLRYINLRLDLKNIRKSIQSEEKSRFLSRARKLKSAIMQDPTSQPMTDLNALELEIWKEIQTLQIPNISRDSLFYQVVADPLLFFPSYCRLSQLYEKHNYTQFNAIPLRRSLIQSHVRIDTKILCTHILCITQTQANAELDKDLLWERVFNLRRKAFRIRNGMRFSRSITTDGTSVSVLLSHPDAERYGMKTKRKSAAILQAELKELYVENNLSAFQGEQKIVVVDPNKRDILYCQDNNGVKFRYTSSQRSKETGSKKFRKKREMKKKEFGIEVQESNIPHSQDNAAFNVYPISPSSCFNFGTSNRIL